jgi:hypothetical protein
MSDQASFKLMTTHQFNNTKLVKLKAQVQELTGLSVMETEENQLKTSQFNNTLLVALVAQVLVLSGNSETTTISKSKAISTKLVIKKLLAKLLDGLKEIKPLLTCQELKVISIKLEHKLSAVKFMD